MVPERQNNGCETVQGDLVRLVCGDVAEPSAALAAHLQACATCRATLAASRDLVDALQDALAPGPLSDRLVADIQARLATRAAARSPARVIALLVPCAAAACLALALLIPWRLAPSSETTGPGSLAVAAANGDEPWDSPSQSSVDAFVKDLEKAAGALEKQRAANSVLPWGPEDDWDVPTDHKGASRIRGLEIHDETGFRICAARNVRAVGGVVCRG
jgi:hypothetical protein